MNLHRAFLGRLLAIACLLASFLVPFQTASADPAAALVRFEATPGPSGIGVVWETASELNTIAFRLYRSLEASPGDLGVALYLVAAHGDPVSGWTYSYIDTAVVPGTTYYYMLEDIDDGGMATSHAPVAAVAVFGCGAVTEIPQTECEALVALYDSTSGPGWTGSTGWLVTNTPCSWSGVSCFADGHVTNIRLPFSQLSGNIPPELGNLANLQWLYLSHNQLSGALPFEEFRDTIEKAKQGLCTPGVQFFDIDPARPSFTTDGSPTRGAVKRRQS